MTPEAAEFSVTNTGRRDGAEVVQLYVHAKNPSVYRPAKELKGFAKVFLKAGETKTVKISLDDKAFRYFNVKSNQFEVDGGEYDILIGASVADIRLTGTVTVKGTGATPPCEMSALPDYASGNILHVPDDEFAALLGRPIPDGSWTGDLRMNDALCQLYYAKSLKARLVYKIMTGMLNKSIQKGEPDLNIIFVYNMPFRGIGKMTGGMVSQEMCRGIVKMVNGHAGAFFSGLGQIAGGFLKQRRVLKKAEKME